MNLKQSDKLIAIIGVIILVIAGVAIIFYTSAEVDTEDVYDPNDKIDFDVNWEEKTETKTIKDNANPTYEDKITISTNTKSVLTFVEFNVIWEDDNVWGLLKNGKDTLKVEISSSNGKSDEDQSTGSGNMSLGFSISGSDDRDNYIEAEDEEEAKELIMNKIEDFNEESFDITITVNTGEKIKLLQPIRSLLNKFKDKGNDFEIEYTYTYYTFDIEEPEDEEDDDKNTGFDISTGSNGSIGDFYTSLAYGRSFI
jgi:hypothetical protein